METLEKIFAAKLLKVKAIKLQPTNPFTWASGWKSPFYCDNRKTLSYPELRNFVKIEIGRLIAERFPEADAIAGVATGAIPQGALVADLLNLPFVYVRSKPKDPTCFFTRLRARTGVLAILYLPRLFFDRLTWTLTGTRISFSTLTTYR